MALDVVVVEYEVNVDDREEHERPHDGVVENAQRELAAEEGRDPGEKPGKPGMAHRRVEGVAGNDLEHRQQPGSGVGEIGHRVVPERVHGLVRRLKDVDLQHGADLRELAAGQGEVISPAGVLVSDKRPVQPEGEIEGEHIGRREMDVPDPAEPIAGPCLAHAHEGGRVGYEPSGDTEDGDSQGVDPMEPAHGLLPYVHPLVIVRTFVGAVHDDPFI